MDFKKHFLTEQQKKQKFGHIEHIEDLIIDEGMEGFVMIKRAFDGVIDICNGNKSDVVISGKWDGSPNITFGFDNSGKFWVATKALFNKKPKINYTPEDVNRNHDSPGLNKKLNYALRFLPEIKSKGITSADILFTADDIKTQTINNKKMLTFKANTVVYGVEVGSKLSQQISVAKIGMVMHTKFGGTTPSNFQAIYNPSISFTPSPNVFVANPYQVNTTKFTPQEMTELETLGEFKVDPKIFDIMRETKNAQMFKRYSNQLVRNGQIDTDPTTFYIGLKEFFEVNDNRIFKHFTEELLSLCDAYLRIIKIKKLVLRHLSDPEEVHSFISDGGNLVPIFGEGFVVVVDNVPLKLIDRAVFSKANFNQKKDWDQPPPAPVQ